MSAIATISRYEIERDKPIPDKLHAFVQQQLLFFILLNYRNQYEVLPELNILLNGTKYVPDLAIYPKGALNFKQNETTLDDIPSAAVEILSGQQPIQTLINKMEVYLAAGVQSYWLVVPALKTIHIFHSPHESMVFSQNDELIDEKLGIKLRLAEVFDQL